MFGVNVPSRVVKVTLLGGACVLDMAVDVVGRFWRRENAKGTLVKVKKITNVAIVYRKYNRSVFIPCSIQT